MITTPFRGVLFIFLGLILTTGKTQSVNTPKPVDVSMFPKPEKGYAQFVIALPHQKNESNYMVELFIGQRMRVDCNQHSMSGSLTEHSLDGWGYTYFQSVSTGEPISTLKACPTEEKRLTFVSLPPKKVPYRNALPIIVYAPEKWEVTYKIWKTNQEFFNAKKVNVSK